MSTEYLWLEERVSISDGIPRNRSEWGAWPGKCFIHRNGVEGKMKEFIKEIHKSIMPSEEKTLTRLEEVLCCCGNRQSHKSVVGRSFGYTAGVNLPEDAHEERQMHLIEQLHNGFNSIVTEQNAEATSDTTSNLQVKITKFLEETLESHRYRVYNPSVVRLLHILKQYMEKPLVEYTEIPLIDFVKLIEGPFWEECAEKLRTRFCTNIFVDFNSEVIDAGSIGIYLEGPSLIELKGVKNNLTTYIDKTKNPPKEKTKTDEADKTTEKDEQTVESPETGKTEDEEGKVTEDSNEVENVAKTSEESDSADKNETSEPRVEEPEKDAIKTYVNDKKRDSRSVDRSAESESSNKEVFTRSKSVPASSSSEVQEPQSQKAKRAKYDSECSNEIILLPDPTQELTLFKETLSLVLVNKLEDNNSLVNL